MRKLLPLGALAGTAVVIIIGLLVALPLSVLVIGSASSANGAICTPGDTPGTVPAEYRQDIADAASHSGISQAVLAAQINQESGWDPTAVSPVGAQGLAQFMPSTWAAYGRGADPFDPHAAIAAQGRLMKDLYGLAGTHTTDPAERIRLALVGYNAGPAHMDTPTAQLPAETRDYTAKILTAAGASGTAGTPVCSGLGALNIEGVRGDDYPHREPIGAEGWSQPPSIFGHTRRQCTDFVMWRINQAMGWTLDSDTPPPFTFRALGVGYGAGQSGAGSWRDIFAQVPGTSFHTADPQPGDIAWWGYGDIGGGYGHVGFVAAVDGDTAVIEHYNLDAPNTYSVTQVPATSVPGYIRITN